MGKLQELNKHIAFRIFLVFLYFVLTLGIEVIYRHPFFDWSFKIQRDIYYNTPKSMVPLYQFFTLLGTIKIVIPFGLIIFSVLPLNITFIIFSEISYAAFLTGVFKGVYGEKRPFWDDFNIMRVCDPGYGNPSGHCITSFSAYISMAHLICNKNLISNKKAEKVMKVLLVLFVIVLDLSILASRFYMSSHSINQLILGSMLGIGLYLYYFYALKLHLYNGKQFSNYICTTSHIVLHTIKYILMLSFLIIFPLIRTNEVKKYEENIEKYCPGLPIYRKFNRESTFSGLCIFYLMGIHLGLTILFIVLKKKYPTQEEIINSWQECTVCKKIIRFFLLFPALLPILLILIPNDEYYFLVFVRVGFPIMCTGILMTSVYIMVCIRCKLANPEFENGMKVLKEDKVEEVVNVCLETPGNINNLSKENSKDFQKIEMDSTVDKDNDKKDNADNKV